MLGGGGVRGSWGGGYRKSMLLCYRALQRGIAAILSQIAVE